MSTVYPTINGFVGYGDGLEAQLCDDEAWDSGHPLVRERPELFRDELDVAVDEWVAANPDPAGRRYDAMKLSDLRTELAARGLPTSGNKTDLAARLGAADTAAAG